MLNSLLTLAAGFLGTDFEKHAVYRLIYQATFCRLMYAVKRKIGISEFHTMGAVYKNNCLTVRSSRNFLR